MKPKRKTLAPRRSRKPFIKSGVAVPLTLKQARETLKQIRDMDPVPHVTHLFEPEGLWEGSQCTFRGCPVRLNGHGFVKLYGEKILGIMETWVDGKPLGANNETHQ